MNSLYYSDNDSLPNITQHADSRMGSRRIRHIDVEVAINYGRRYHVRGAVIFAMGRREVAFCRARGLLVDKTQGLQVVCNSNEDTVITVYRNNDFRGLRRNTNRKRRSLAEN
jgi:hypothetical protein